MPRPASPNNVRISDLMDFAETRPQGFGVKAAALHLGVSARYARCIVHAAVDQGLLVREPESYPHVWRKAPKPAALTGLREPTNPPRVKVDDPPKPEAQRIAEEASNIINQCAAHLGISHLANVGEVGLALYRLGLVELRRRAAGILNNNAGEE